MGTTTTWTLAALKGRTMPNSSPWIETTSAAILETPGPKQVDSGTTFSPLGERKVTPKGFATVLRSFRDCKHWDGRKAATFGSNNVGPAVLSMQ